VKINYRPEIDGLRAISVFAVILYHANFILFGDNYKYFLFKGGFIGVDIFFVISGYLITTLILKEILKTNKFSFKKFYERRVRRVLPALLFCCIITSIVGYFILLPPSLIDFGKSILSIIFFSSNIYFWITGNRYGEESELLKPLLHSSSLSVEEQFYILFPIFLIIVIKFFKKNFFWILLVFFSSSLAFSEWAVTTNIKINYIFFRWDIVFFEKFNFYFLLSRVFELLAGSFIAYFELNNFFRLRKPYLILNKICPILGIVLIFYSFILFDYSKISHPGFATLIPLIGASLIICFAKKGGLIAKILSNKIFAFLGVISYSLYLWHYPIFAYLRYVDIFNNSVQIKLLAILLTIILSILSYYFIERTFRNKNIISVKILNTYIFISVVILLSYSFYIQKTDGIKNRFPNIISEKLNEDIKEHQYSKGNKGSIFLIGDSHSNSLKYHLNNELKKNYYSLFSEKNCCDFFYLPNFNIVDRKTKYIYKNNLENTINIDKFLKNNKNLIVVWHQRWSSLLTETNFDNEEGYKDYDKEKDRISLRYFEPINITTSSSEERQKYISEGLKSSINNILKQGHILILVYPVPEMGFHVPRLALKKYSTVLDKLSIKNKNIDVPILTGNYDVYKKRNKMIFEILDSITSPHVYRVYPDKSFCNTIIVNRCVANSKEHLFYYDNNHLSLEGSKYVVNDIIKIIKKVEVSKKN